MTATGRIDASALVGVVAGWLFNYNTVEQLLLASAMFVALLLIMFIAANGADAGIANQWSSGLADFAIAVVAITIVYWFVVVCTDIFFMWNDAVSRAAVARSRAAGGKKAGSSRRGSASRRSVVIGPVDTSVNPLFITGQAGGGGAAGTASAIAGGGNKALADALTASTQPPPPELWAMFRGSFLGLLTQVRARHLQIRVCFTRRRCRRYA